MMVLKSLVDRWHDFWWDVWLWFSPWRVFDHEEEDEHEDRACQGHTHPDSL
jgi:hypothetical protein